MVIPTRVSIFAMCSVAYGPCAEKDSDLDYREIHENEELAAFLATLSVN